MRTARWWGELGVVLLVASTGCDAPKGAAPTSASASAGATAAPPGTVSPDGAIGIGLGSASGSTSPSAIPSAGAVPSATGVEPTSVAAQHVLIAYKGAAGAPKTVMRSKADARTRADEVLAKAKGGADFTSLVTEYSDDPAAKERAGSVGKFTRDKMEKPFSDAAFALAVGGVSAPVETKYGFHVIKRNQ